MLKENSVYLPEVFSSQKHKLSKKDTKKIMKDLKEWREQREQDSINMFYSELENVVGKKESNQYPT